ncbi:MAG: DNA translocase FtsK 4TM domain-containing protein [Rhodospirillales bacterium]|nr:DNA translocase FtsK 4TM domain-containing protein [Rhodospirillales bacterium]
MARAIPQNRRRTLLPAAFADALRQRLIELSGIGVFAAALLIGAALATYSPADPSLNNATGSAVQNVLGLPGAIAADLAWQFFGLAGWAAPLVLVAWAWRLAGRKLLSLVWFRLLAVIAGMLALSVAAAPLPAPGDWPLRAGMGGASGDVLTGLVLGWLPAGTGAAGGWALAGAGVLLSLGLLSFAAGLDRTEWAYMWGMVRRGGGLARRWVGGISRVPKDTGQRVEPRLAGEPAARDEFGSGLGSELGDEFGAGEEPGGPPARRRKPKSVVEPRKPGTKAGKRAKDARQGSLVMPVADIFQVPPLDLLEAPPASAANTADKDALSKNASLLESVLDDFGVRGEIVKVRPGPVVTLYELEPAPGTKTSRVIGLSDDIARSMSALSVRIAVVPGRSVIGIELPNARRETVYLRELLASGAYERSGGSLTLVLGKDIGGGPMMVDLARMPHLLIAGTTGSGKSVAINTMILSLLYRLSPDQCKFIMIDPKMLELSVYDGIPNLLAPVVTDPSKAVVALKWAVREMEERYRDMSRMGVRNIAGYNARLAEARKKGEELTRRVQTGFDETGKPVYEDQPLGTDPLPFIVVVVDEMADLMMVAGKDIEAAVQRLAQMARAAGIHLITATQRPSVDVITGTIKANFPTRISFQVTSKVDSRTILGEQGAEQLLGQGDMLYMAGGGQIARIHGPFVSDEEVEQVVKFLKSQGEPAYEDAVTEDADGGFGAPGAAPGETGDDLYDQAVAIVTREGKASTSFIQRHLQIGYNRAARIIERMEAEGVVSQADRVGRREVLAGSH